MKHLTTFKLFEGKTMKASKSDNQVKKTEFKSKIEELIRSFDDVTFKTVGNDLEVKKGDQVLVQIMFRDDYMGVKKINNKFPKEFKYTELGKMKKELKDIFL